MLLVKDLIEHLKNYPDDFPVIMQIFDENDEPIDTSYSIDASAQQNGFVVLCSMEPHNV